MRLFMSAAVVLLVGSLAGCGSGDDVPDAGPFTTELTCPKPGSLPFVTSERDWRVEANEGEVTAQPRIKHQPADIMTTPTGGAAYTDLAGNAPLETGNLKVRGVMARIENQRGLAADAIADEFVSAWQYDETNGWVELGMQVSGTFDSATPGGFEIETDSPTIGQDFVTRYSVLNAEGTCGTHRVFELAAGRQVVLSDIDATLTATDNDILSQIPDPTYDPVEMGSSVALTNAWTNKGYQMVYITARAHLFRSETRAWLEAHGYPPGPVITASESVFDEAARAYKGLWVTRIRTELQWDIVAAYGNAESDIDAYEDGGIDKDITFTIGPEAGTKGTVAIPNEDYADHIQSYVMAQPDADHL